jgi:cholesterol transport system auxiliary component
MKIRMTGLFILVLLLTVSGCSILPQTQPSAVHDFGVPNANSSPEASTSTQQSPITVQAPKWLVDSRIRYRLLYATPTQVRFYSLDRWIAPPSELFEQLLNASGKQQPKSATIQLAVFEQQFDTATQAKVVIHFTVTTVAEDNKHQVNKRDFRLQLPCPTPDAKGAVTGFTALTKQANDMVQAWLADAN